MGGRGLIAAAVAVALGAGSACYAPQVDSCLYACNQGKCPDGLECNAQSMCAETASTACGPGGDDTTPPETLLTSMPPAIDSASSVMFSFMSSETGGHFECEHDEAGFAPCSSPDTMGGLATGMHTFRVRAYDDAGNVDPTPAAYTWMVDTTLPETELMGPPPPSFMNTTSVSIAFSSPNITGATFECALDTATFTACTSPQMLTNLSEAAHTFQVRAKSSLGTVDPSPLVAMFTVDVTSPTTTITSSPTDPNNMATGSSVNATSSETPALFECALDAAPFTTCTMPYTIPGSLSNGTHSFKVRAKDQAGNLDATPALASWTTDLVAPTVTFQSPSPAMNGTTGPHVGFAWTTSETATTTCALDSATATACTSPMTMQVGHGASHTFTVKATDAAGNTSTTTRTWNVNCAMITVTGATGIFHFDEASGQTLTNSSTGHTDAVLGTTSGVETIDPMRVAGRVGSGALRFANSDMTASLNDATVTTPATDMTFEVFYNPLPASNVQFDIMSTKTGNASIYQIAGSTVSLGFVVYDATATPHVATVTTTANVWHQLVATYSSSTHIATLYIDGAVGGTAMVPAAAPPAFALGQITWGKLMNNGGGSIDEAIVATSAATSTEVADQYCPN